MIPLSNILHRKWWNKNYKWIVLWGGISLVVGLLFIFIPMPESNRDGIFPEREIKILYSKDLQISNPEVYIFTYTEPNYIYFRFHPDVHDRTKWGGIALVLPYHGVLGDNSGWQFTQFEENAVLIKEYNCIELQPCKNPSNPEFFEFYLDRKIDSKQSFHHSVRFKFANNAPTEPEYGHIREFNQNDENYELGFSKLTDPKVIVALDKTADNILPEPTPDFPSSFADKNLQRIWLIKDRITYQVDYQIPWERDYDDTLGNYVTIFSIILTLGGIACTIFFRGTKFIKHQTDPQKSPIITREHSQSLNKDVFQKLQYLYVIEDREKTSSLRVPRDQMAYTNHYSWLIQQIERGRDPSDFDKIEEIKHLEAALSHLKDDFYKNIEQPWKELNKNVVEYNKKIPQVLENIKRKLELEMKKQLEKFSEFKGDSTPSYFSEHIVYLLFDKFWVVLSNNQDKPKFRFDLVHILPEWSLFSDYGTILQSNDKSLLDIAKLEKTFHIILEDSDLLEQFRDLAKYHDNINKFLEEFSNQIKKLVNNIEIGAILKGSCDACS